MTTEPIFATNAFQHEHGTIRLEKWPEGILLWVGGTIRWKSWGQEEKKSISDSVNHPKHYNDHPSGVECITIVEHMTFNIGNAIKYLWRAGLKVSAEPMLKTQTHIEDLKKARWYIAREIEKLGGTP